MLDTFTLDTFRPLVGERFRVSRDDDRATVVHLAEATPWGEEFAGRGRTPFSLLFRGDAGTVFPQAIYRVECEAMEPFELFLVPIGPDAEGMRYEAVFT